MDLGVILAVVVAVLAVWACLVLVFWLLRPRGVALRELVRVVPDVIRLLKSIATDRVAPLDVRVAVVLLAAWILSPIDLIPEFIPVLGPFDDVVVAVLALRYIRRRMGAEALRARWKGSEDGFRLLTSIMGR